MGAGCDGASVKTGCNHILSNLLLQEQCVESTLGEL